MYLAAEVQAAGAGYRHYEISNWAIPGRESRHNLLYWRNRPFLGVGPGAHSYLDGHRFHNIRSPREYIRRLDSPRPSFPCRREPIPGPAALDSRLRGNDECVGGNDGYTPPSRRMRARTWPSG